MEKPRKIAIQLDLEWPFKRHAALFAGTQQYGREHNWESIIDEYVADNLSLNDPKFAQYDGVIARATEKLAECTKQMSIPLVNVWNNSPVRDQLPGVFLNYEISGRNLAEHLMARGLRRFAVVVRKDRGRIQEAAVFKNIVQEAGFPCLTTTIPLHNARNHSVWLKTQNKLDAFIDDWELPIGVIVDDEKSGRTIVQRCSNRGWRVPQDVAIIAGSNETVLCENPRPSLTSTEYGFERIGYEAARMLDQMLDDKEKGKQAQKSPENIILPPQGIVIRESTDFYAVDDETIAEALLFISKKSHRSIGPNDVAKAVSLEPRTLRRRFAKVLGRTIISEITRVRMERAKRELVQSSRSLDTIARDVGFGTSRQMREVFLRELNVTPREYRKKRRINA